jgi:hypothetical protein
MTPARRCCEEGICAALPTSRVEEHPMNIAASNAPAMALTRALISEQCTGRLVPITTRVVTIAAFPVSHGLMTPPFGDRVNYTPRILTC